MKTNSTKFLWHIFMLVGAVLVLNFTSCKEEEPAPDPIASFQYAISETNYLQVTFTNYSQNAVSYSWAFGDGETSTEENPVHVYAAAGSYEVVLTATNKDNATHAFTQTIQITNPFEALEKLTGETSKTWKLYRLETSMGVGPNAEQPRIWWALSNDGTRPCVYFHEFTFFKNGNFVFDDKDSFWGEEAIFGAGLAATCFAATTENMVNKDGADVSAWLGGTHTFTYDPTQNQITLTGNGAWMGLPQLGTSEATMVPVATKTFKAVIEEFEGYDLLTISYTYADLYWDFTYASYSTATEPDVVTEEEPWGEDLENITPDDIFLTFASREAAAMATIDTITSGSTVVFGVNDPTDANAAKVGEFTRTAGVQYQELQFRAAPDPKDIQFTNFTTAKIDIFIPANTNFTTLQRHIVFGFADQSQTQEWWNSPVQFVKEGEDVVLGAWTTYTFDLTDVKARADLDMIYLGIGGGGHTEGGTFYIRNLIFE